MSYKINFLFVLLFASYNSVSAQQDLGTAFLQNAWQVNYINPAQTPENMKVAISFPGFYSNLSTPISLNNILTPTETGNLLDVEKALSKLNNQNILSTNLHLHSFDVAIAVKKFTFSVGHALRNDFSFNFPKELVQLGWYGNAAFVGENVQIAPKFSLNSFNQYSFGASYQMDIFTFGGKVKLLTGIATLNSKNADVTLGTNSDVYQLSFGGNYSIQTAGFIEFDPENGIEVDGTALQNNLLFSENIGLGFDFGATMQLGEKLTIGASVLDIGSIRWKTLANVYSTNGEATFEGINLIHYTQDFSLSFEEKKDSILNYFNVEQRSESFTSSLSSRIYIHADYQFNDYLSFGGLLYAENFRRGPNAALSANATVHFGKFLDLGASYSIKQNSLTNIGVNGVLSLGPVQFFAMTDNIIAAFSPESQRNANFRTGMNLIFKEKKSKKNGEYVPNQSSGRAPSIACPNF